MEGLDLSKIPMDLILNIFNILLLFIIVRALVYKPVKKFMDKRSAAVSDANKSADNRIAEAERLHAEYEEKLAKSAEDGRALIRDSETKAAAEASGIIENAKHDAQALLDEARRKADAERAASLAALRGEVCDLSLKIAGRVIEKNVVDDDNRRLADELFTEITNGVGKGV